MCTREQDTRLDKSADVVWVFREDESEAKEEAGRVKEENEDEENEDGEKEDEEEKSEKNEESKKEQEQKQE